MGAWVQNNVVHHVTIFFPARQQLIVPIHFKQPPLKEIE